MNIIYKIMTSMFKTEEYVIVGSSVLQQQGILENVEDLDMVLSLNGWGRIWEFSRTHKEGHGIFFIDGYGKPAYRYDDETSFPSEFFMELSYYKMTATELIDNNLTDLIEGVRFLKLDAHIKWMRWKNRPKDILRLKLLEEKGLI